MGSDERMSEELARMLDRRVSRQQAIEALRMHASASGKLPEKLEDVEIVPVPLDPATSQPFRYLLNGDVAVLDVADEMGMQPADLQMPVRIRLRGKWTKRAQC